MYKVLGAYYEGILGRYKGYLLIILGAFFFASLSQAADTVTFGDTTYKIASEGNNRSVWLSRKNKDAMKTIYTTGVEGVFCSIPIYQNLQKGIRGSCSGLEVILFDSLKTRAVSTGIWSVSYGNSNNDGSIVNGKSLDETNSICFHSIEEFFRWIDDSLNK